MPFLMLVMGLVGGLVVVGLLLLLEAVMRAFQPGWMLPFSAWWGLLLSIPAILGSVRTGVRGAGRIQAQRRQSRDAIDPVARPPS